MEPKPTTPSHYKAAWQGFLLHAEHSLVAHKNEITHNRDKSMKQIMTNKYNSVAEINAEKESWRIMVRVVRLWMVLDVLTNKQTSSNKISFSMEMVLVDSKDATILFSKSCANMFETYMKDLMTKFSYVENDCMRELTSNESESTTQHKKNVVHNNYYGDLIPVGTVFGTRIQ
ncbi:hypothetical protein JHK82_035145 [Glycine max]|nr:hypothetical protein JHK82_035145 [Glycine max]